MLGHELTHLFETLGKIRDTTKRKEKDAFMSSLAKSKFAKQFFTLAVDKRANLWVTAPDLKSIYFKGKRGPVDYDHRLDEFKKLFSDLSRRRVTGSAAIKRALDFIASCSNEAPTFEATWYAGAIDRHLNIGVSSASLHKVWPDLVNDFAVQLAESLYDQKTMTVVEKVKKTIVYPCVVEPKLDGISGSLVSLVSSTTAYSRGNSAFPALRPWCDAFEQVLSQIAGRGNGMIDRQFVLNGEFKADLHPDDPKNWNSSWGKSMALCHAGIKPTGYDPTTIDAYVRTCLRRDLYFTVYNCYPASLYTSESWDVRYGSNDEKYTRSWFSKQFVLAMRKLHPELRVDFIPQIVCSTFEEAQAANKHWVDLGYEGSMIKDCSAPCILDRGTWFIKNKQYKKVDAVILGVNLGTGKYANVGGALVCRLASGEKANVTCRTEAVRNWAGKNKELLAGFQLEVIADGASEQTGIIRNPILKRFRADVKPITLDKVAVWCRQFKLPIPTKQLTTAEFNRVAYSFK
jgi:hypothetical protein